MTAGVAPASFGNTPTAAAFTSSFASSSSAVTRFTVSSPASPHCPSASTAATRTNGSLSCSAPAIAVRPFRVGKATTPKARIA